MKLKVIAIVAISLVAVASFPALSSCSLSGNGNLKISVQDNFHSAMMGAKVVSKSQPSGQPKIQGVTERNGEVVFDNIEAGAYEIQVSGGNFDQTLINVTLKSRETQVVVVIVRYNYVKTTP